MDYITTVYKGTDDMLNITNGLDDNSKGLYADQGP